MPALLAVVCRDGDEVRNPELHGPHVERAHQRLVVAVRARLHCPSQAAPHQNVTPCDDLRTRVDVADDADVPVVADALPRAQGGLDEDGWAAALGLVNRGQLAVLVLLEGGGFVEIRVDVQPARRADRLGRLAEDGGKLDVMLGQPVPQLTNLFPVQFAASYLKRQPGPAEEVLSLLDRADERGFDFVPGSVFIQRDEQPITDTLDRNGCHPLAPPSQHISVIVVGASRRRNRFGAYPAARLPSPEYGAAPMGGPPREPAGGSQQRSFTARPRVVIAGKLLQC